MRRNRWGGLAAAVLMVMGLCSCTAGTTTSTQHSVALVAKSTQTEFWLSVFAGAEAAATEYNVKLTIVGPETEEDYETQNRMVAQAVADGAEALVFSAIDYENNAVAIDDAAGQGVRIVAIDSNVDSSAVSTYIGTDNYAAGQMAARAALEACDLIVGYTAYIDLVRADFPQKETLSTGMRREVDRCRAAVEAARTGKDVAVVCSGDSGVYGMAGLIYEVAQEYDPIEIEVVPGITAACGGAAVLGAPLTHDFAVVSLSDLLTPWEKITARLTAAAQADFVLCLYNPASHSRPDYLQRACDILLSAGKDPATVCGTVRNIGRAGEEAALLTLGELRDTQVDMFTTVFVGNSQTKVIGGKMVTPRGYLQRGE